MSNVQFEEEQADTARYVKYGQTPTGIIGFLLKRGIVKDENQANYVLIGVIILVICVIVGIAFIPSGSTKTSHPIDKEAMQRMLQNMEQNR